MTYNVDVLKKIKSKGYWKIVITPDTYKKDRLSLSKCKEIVEKSKVLKRGWYYPYISEVGDTLGIGFNLNNCFTNSIDWEYHTEIWKMYTSGQFVHYLALREDWRAENLPTSNRKNVLGIIMTLYSVTEIFLFISNLARNGLYDNRVNLILELHGILGKILVFHEQPHEILRELYNTYESKNLSIKIEKDFSKNEVISSSALLAMKTVAEIFERFNWSASEDILRNDQEEFIRGFV